MFRFLKLASQHIQARDVEKAMDAFTSAVQLDPDNGEAWNNIACLYDLSHLEHASSIFFFFPIYSRYGFTSYPSFLLNL